MLIIGSLSCIFIYILQVKEIRQSFSNAVTTGKRSGSGKIVFEHYDRLVSLWGGCAGITPLAFGVDANNFDPDQQAEADEKDLDDRYIEDEERDNNSDGVEIDNGNDEDNTVKEIKEDSARTVVKRKSESQVAKLIDNKRKHLEKSLSAAQRDQLLVNEAKEDSKFRKDLAEAMQQSTISFSRALEGVSQSMIQIGTGLCRSLENLAQAMQDPQPPRQNVYYQQPNGSIFGNSFSGLLSTIPVGYARSNVLPPEHVNDDTRFHTI